MKCPNCILEMDSNYMLKPNNAPLANTILQKKNKVYKVMAYVCPQCGKIEFYIDCKKEESHE